MERRTTQRKRQTKTERETKEGGGGESSRAGLHLHFSSYWPYGKTSLTPYIDKSATLLQTHCCPVGRDRVIFRRLQSHS